MSRPRVILHNTVSMDGAVSGFDVDIGLHYEIAGSLGAQAHLVGSLTARAGIEVDGVPEETEIDYLRPPPRGEELRPLWFIIDSTARLEGMLHVLRRAGYSRDVVLLVAGSTPPEYLEYLALRDYPMHVAGEERVDLERVLTLMAEEYGVETVLADSGGALVSALLDQELASALSLVVAPAIVGGDAPRLFDALTRPHPLVLKRQTALRAGHVHLLYEIPDDAGARTTTDGHG